jgi:predicted glycosyltransferase
MNTQDHSTTNGESWRTPVADHRAREKKIWIDLDNTPHVPFFLPIIRELEGRGYEVCVTARDCFQVCSLADLMGVAYAPIGRHYGKHRLMKALGTVYRSAQLFPRAWREKAALAVSHGSRSQLLAARCARIPSLVIVDYEFASPVPGCRPTWVMAPEIIPETSIQFGGNQILKYPGIKEDVYVPDFKPNPEMRTKMGFREDAMVVVVRPPATEAHYHNPESEGLFDAVMGRIQQTEGVQAVVVPRNGRQAAEIRRAWPALFAEGKVLIPDRAIDGLNLIWHADLVISGGGTMNREAAALGVPVYSIFRGAVGAVDRYLAACGRLVLLESVKDVHMKLILRRRTRESVATVTGRVTLEVVVDHIVKAAAAFPGASRTAHPPKLVVE